MTVTTIRDRITAACSHQPGIEIIDTDEAKRVGGWKFFVPAGTIIVSFDVSNQDALRVMAQLYPLATLPVIRADGVRLLFVPASNGKKMSASEFLSLMNLDVTLGDNPIKAFKYLARLIVRPFEYSAKLSSKEVTVKFAEQDDNGDYELPEGEIGDAASDGLCIINLAMLRAMNINRPEGKKTKKAKKNLMDSRRGEMTLAGKFGLVKGNYLVDVKLNNRKPIIIIYKNGIKKAVKTTDDVVYIGLGPQHASKGGSLDLQTIANQISTGLSPELLMNMVMDESRHYLTSLMKNNVEALFGNMGIDEDNDLEDMAIKWPEMYAAISGANPMQFRGIMTSLGRQHIQRITRIGEGIQIPCEEMWRFYVATDIIGMQANLLETPIKRGTVYCDNKNQTVWFNHEDWHGLSDSPNGYGAKDLFGGADHDDSVVIRVVEHNGFLKLMLTRQPNEKGEWLIMNIDERNLDMFKTAMHKVPFDIIEQRIDWLVYKGVVKYIQLDESKTIARNNFLDSIEQFGTNEFINRFKFDALVAQVSANAGILGRYVNLLMAAAACGTFLSHQIRLEQIVDLAVQSNGDAEQAVEVIKQLVEELFRNNSVPAYFVERIAHEVRGPDGQMKVMPIVDNGTSAFAILNNQLNQHIKDYQDALEKIGDQCRLPDVLRNGDDLSLFASQIYLDYIQAYSRFGESQPPKLAAEHAALVASNQLNLLPVELQLPIIRSLAIWIESTPKQDGSRRSDSMLWQSPISEWWLKVLQDHAIIGSAICDNQVIVTVGESETPINYMGNMKALVIHAVWFNAINRSANQYDSMGLVPKELADKYKSPEVMGQIAQKMVGRQIVVADNSLIKDEKGIVGSLRKQEAPASKMAIRYAIPSRDGSVVVLVAVA